MLRDGDADSDREATIGYGRNDEGDRRSHRDGGWYREAYGVLLGELKHRSADFESFERRLGQAGISRTYDEYLMRAIKRAVAVALLALGVQLILLLAVSSGVIRAEAIRRSLFTAPWMTGGLALALSVVAGLSVFTTYWAYPIGKASYRARQIDSTLPHAVVFMGALSAGGLPLIEILRKIAEAEDVYGEVATEFGGIVVDVDRFNLDLLTALEAGKRFTPSADFREFLDNLMGVLESGSDLNAFLRDASESQLTLARQRQENFLNTLATLAEAHFTLVFAGPIFLVVVLMVMSFSGSSTVRYIRLITYVGVPLGILGFILLIDYLSVSHKEAARLRPAEPLETSADVESSRFTQYRRHRLRLSITRRWKQPLSALRERPLRSLWISIPLAGFVWLGFVGTGLVSPSVEAYRSRPIWTTTWALVVPLLVPSVGLMTAYELRRVRDENVKRRFPDVLKTLVSANKNGISLVDSITLLTHRSEGVLSLQLKNLDRDIRLTGRVHDAFCRFAVGVGVPRVSQVTKIIIEGDKSSEGLSSVLEIVAADVEERYRLEIDRKKEMSAYTVIFLVGVAVYLLIVFLFNEFFFPTVAGMSVGAESIRTSSGGTASPVPISVYRTALFHSALIQSVGNGLLIGKLVENNVVGGLKYANTPVLLVLVVFTVV